MIKAVSGPEIEAIGDIQDVNSKYRKIIQAGIARWIKDFQEGRIKFKTVDDLKKLIEMDIVLQKNDYANSLRRARQNVRTKTG